ncbi:MAG: thiamine diphosphokinase [Ignavibacteria bacterium]|nr:thiamine diphosphokinase [Ignavibacteria bacterium]
MKFTTGGIDAVVCLNGVIPDVEVFSAFASMPLIAADGAIVPISELGISAEFIVGDLDSVPQELLAEVKGISEIIHDPDQNSNDFEKALRFASAQLWNRLMVVGMHGGDLEHTLNNWSVLMRYAQSMEIIVHEMNRVAIPIFSSFTFSPNENEILSLVPQPHARISTRGLVWNLNDEELSLGTRTSARNRSHADVVEVTLHEGSLLFFCDARLPLTPIID